MLKNQAVKWHINLLSDRIIAVHYKGNRFIIVCIMEFEIPHVSWENFSFSHLTDSFCLEMWTLMKSPTRITCHQLKRCRKGRRKRLERGRSCYRWWIFPCKSMRCIIVPAFSSQQRVVKFKMEQNSLNKKHFIIIFATPLLSSYVICHGRAQGFNLYLSAVTDLTLYIAQSFQCNSSLLTFSGILSLLVTPAIIISLEPYFDWFIALQHITLGQQVAFQCYINRLYKFKFKLLNFVTRGIFLVSKNMYNSIYVTKHCVLEA